VDEIPLGGPVGRKKFGRRVARWEAGTCPVGRTPTLPPGRPLGAAQMPIGRPPYGVTWDSRRVSRREGGLPTGEKVSCRVVHDSQL
jgi:hypothetical protein